jgi:hypothetical protein
MMIEHSLGRCMLGIAVESRVRECSDVRVDTAEVAHDSQKQAATVGSESEAVSLSRASTQCGIP